MKNWWEKAEGTEIESRADRYHRRILEVIKYTQYLLNWQTSIVDHADKQLTYQGVSTYCQTAATNFKNFTLAPNAASTYAHYASDCADFLTTFSTTIISNTCNAYASTWYDTQNKSITLDRNVAARAGGACANLSSFLISTVTPYLDLVAPVMRCDAGHQVSSRAQYSRAPCQITLDDANTCRNTTNPVEAIAPTASPSC